MEQGGRRGGMSIGHMANFHACGGQSPAPQNLSLLSSPSIGLCPSLPVPSPLSKSSCLALDMAWSLSPPFFFGGGVAGTGIRRGPRGPVLAPHDAAPRALPPLAQRRPRLQEAVHFCWGGGEARAGQGGQPQPGVDSQACPRGPRPAAAGCCPRRGLHRGAVLRGAERPARPPRLGGGRTCRRRHQIAQRKHSRDRREHRRGHRDRSGGQVHTGPQAAPGDTRALPEDEQADAHEAVALCLRCFVSAQSFFGNCSGREALLGH
mmetsp:Transcript_39679/g.94199  ORF Transcript_39679/g.94199 Transcript_39679/m.94199 type:complete len:263 (-) Transcript_39679:381-1169(-)